ncbi:MAG: cell division protein FtsH [Candidatus Omnitrophica bacterium CG11_big_fil_rev_8_21_14_0_20_64_10]|nr:MAG: cell division protein FtsH [Candidatus Omnitrophica bacterium CG11_big_fil_rev_8_21_14_0_20_64_10]
MGLGTGWRSFVKNSPYWVRRTLFFLEDNWVKIAIAFFVIGMAGVSVWALSQMESFYRLQQLSFMPLWFLIIIISSIISALIYVSLMFGLMSRQKKKKIIGELINVHFKDVIGIDEAKEEAREMVQLLKDHRRVQQIGGKAIRGLLMQGPPGCGKTYLAKAIATEAKVPFISMAASDFVEIFVGVGSSRVRRIFRDARRLAQIHGAAIIFIDEVDAIGRNRTFGWGGSIETNSTLNSLLVEMDGIQDTDANVVVIGATNAPESSLDVALLRPGRFDRKIYVDRPNLEGRKEVFEYYLSKVKAEPDIDVGRLARWSVYKSPADIENIVKEGALIATRNGRDVIAYKDLSEAMDRIELGVKHRKSMTEGERKLIAYHEGGHLVTTYLIHPTDDVFKASIIARRDSLGMVQPRAREELHTHSRERLLADIKVSLAGYVAEKVVFGVTSDGVASDFRHAFSIARAMVGRLGMGGRYIGDWMSAAGQDGVAWAVMISEDTKRELDQETNKILTDCAAEVEKLLKTERKILDRFAQELLKKEELEYDEIEAIFAEFGQSRKQLADPKAAD